MNMEENKMARKTFTKALCPECSYPQKDCHSVSRGKCLILQDTNFKRPCPFYRSWRAVEKENLQYFPRVQYMQGKVSR